MSRKKREQVPLSPAMERWFQFFRDDPQSIDNKYKSFFVNQAIGSALACGMVKEVKALLSNAGNGPNASELRTILAKPGRPSFGVKNLVTRIGRMNEKMKKEGVSYSDRIERIGNEFGIQTESRIKEILSEFRKEETALLSDIEPE